MRKIMSLCTAELSRLTRLVEGLLDADILLAADAGALLEAIETARQSLSEGGVEAARQHVERLARLTEALVQTDVLALAEGRAVILVTNRILNLEKDAGDEAD
jgi:hypothetical protein